MLPIQKKFVNYNYSKRSKKPTYIVIHDTGNAGASALNHYNYFNGGDRNASADFFVDSNNIIQIINTDFNYSWAVGDGGGIYGITNGNSCSIEMCLENNGIPSDATINNTIELTKYLMSYYGIGINNVVRHYDASRKSCPNSFKANNWSKWNEFKSKLTAQESINNEVVRERKYDMKNLVCYCNQVDKRIAEYLADYLGCPCMDATISFNYDGVAENIIAVGGDNPSKGINGQVGFSGYTTKYLAGNDRYDTIKEVLKFMGKL